MAILPPPGGIEEGTSAGD